MSKTETRICFVLQKRAPGTHMDYVYEMARTLRQDEGLPVTLFLEKGTCDSVDQEWCRAQSFSFAPLRVLENFWRLLLLRLSGHRVFYIHYSFVSTISAGLITKLLGGTVYYWNCGMPWHYKRPWLTELYQKFAYKRIDFLVTGAESLREGYQNTYGLTPEQIKIIPNWIDLEKIQSDPNMKTHVKKELGIPAEAPLLLFVHALVKRKGADLLPEILQTMHNQTSHLIVAGAGSEYDYIEKKAMEYGLADRLHLLGRVDRERVGELLQAADIFIMPSEEEGSPHSLIEAMAYGVPFVSFAVGGVKETAPPEVERFIHEYPDIDSLARSIDILLNDQLTYDTFVSNEVLWVQRYAKSLIVRQFKKLLTH